MTLFYAAMDKNKSKDAKAARDVAYSEGENTNNLSYKYKEIPASNALLQDFSSDGIIKIPATPKTFSAYLKMQEEDDKNLMFLPPIETGIKPTIAEASNMAKNIYNVSKNTDKNEYSSYKVGDWTLIDFKTNKEGLNIGIFSKELNGKTAYAFVNAGSTLSLQNKDKISETKADWINNFQQPFGDSDDMVDSIEYAKEFVREHPDSDITFIGHSKGGAEAAANAVATNKNAILFNPAIVNLNAYGLDAKEYNADMAAYIVDGEILNNIFGEIPTPFYNKVIIGKESFWEKALKPILKGKVQRIMESIDDHSMDTVIKTLNNEGYR